MAFYPIEIFVKITFDEALTYEEVHEIEDSLSIQLQEHFTMLGGEHIDFFPVGDGVQIHFSMRDPQIAPIKKACQELQVMLQEHVHMKLTVLNRELTGIYLCSITHLACEEKIAKLF